jgi:hypothetical protein
MSDLRKAAAMALEALEGHYAQGHSNTLGGIRLKIDEKALRTLKAALAQPDPDLVVMGQIEGHNRAMGVLAQSELTRSQQMRDAGYTRRPRQLPKENEQEPVAWWDGKESVVFVIRECCRCWMKILLLSHFIRGRQND